MENSRWRGITSTLNLDIGVCDRFHDLNDKTFVRWRWTDINRREQVYEDIDPVMKCKILEDTTIIIKRSLNLMNGNL